MRRLFPAGVLLGHRPLLVRTQTVNVENDLSLSARAGGTKRHPGGGSEKVRFSHSQAVDRHGRSGAQTVSATLRFGMRGARTS